MDPDRQKRLNEVAAIAARIEADTKLPARMLITQWALESEWGAKPAGHANYFGIKKSARHTMSCTVETHEFINGKRVLVDLEFADYPSLEDSCRDYAWLITEGKLYREAWEKYEATKDIGALIFDVSQVYATDINYAMLATKIGAQSNIAEAITLALAQEGARAA